MVKFIGIDESEARRRLLAVGTEIVEIGSEGRRPSGFPESSNMRISEGPPAR